MGSSILIQLLWPRLGTDLRPSLDLHGAGPTHEEELVTQDHRSSEHHHHPQLRSELSLRDRDPSLYSKRQREMFSFYPLHASPQPPLS